MPHSDDQQNCYQADFTTIIKDLNEAKLLIDPTTYNDQRDTFHHRGKHVFIDHTLLSENWYWQNMELGKAIITNWGNTENCTNQNYTLMAWYNTKRVDYCSGIPHGNDMIQMSGNITEIRPYEFDFDGTISTPAGVNDNMHYQEQGKFTFSRKNHPKYWSLLRDKENYYADEFFSSVDIYVTHDPDKVFDKPKAIKKIEALKKKCRTLGIFDSP